MNIKIDKLLDDKGRNLIVLVGPPGCGKSTLANQLVDEYGFVKVCPDEIREEVTGDPTDQSHNEMVFGLAYSRIESYLTSNWNVVYDATNCRPAYRYKIVRFARKYASNIICLAATASLMDCCRNIEKRERKVPEYVIENMMTAYKNHPPTVSEGFDAIIGF